MASFVTKLVREELREDEEKEDDTTDDDPQTERKELGQEDDEAPIPPLPALDLRARDEAAGGKVPPKPALVPRLDDLVVKALADNYHVYPALDRIPAEYVDNVVALLDPQQIQFKVAAKYITAEKFWRRLCEERWKVCDLKEHGLSWKRLYCERHVQELLENYQPSEDGENYVRLVEELEAAFPFVHTIRVHQLLSHLELSHLLHKVPNLTTLELKYSARRMGMEYDKARFGMMLTDAISLSAHFFPKTVTLSRLVLRENLLTDDIFEHLVAGLHKNVSVTYLDLSHNRLGDTSAVQVAKLFAPGGVLAYLDLGDNYIREEGALELARVLAESPCLQELSLKLNPIGDEAAAEMLTSVASNKSLTALNLSGTGLAEKGTRALVGTLASNNTLRSLDLCSNKIDQGALPSLLNALSGNKTLTALDLRKCGLSDANMREIQAAIQPNAVKLAQEKRKAMQAKGYDEAM